MEKKYKDKLINDELQIMDEIDRVCKENNIDYFLTAGALLGAIRHGGMIPWDDDIDIAMPRESFDRFINYIHKKMNNKFYLDYYNTNKKHVHPFAKVRLKGTEFRESSVDKSQLWEIWVDVFPLDNISKQDYSFLDKNKKKIKKYNNILVKKYIINFNHFSDFKNKLTYIIAKIIPTNIVVKRINQLMKKSDKENNTYFINYGSKYSVEKQTHEISKYYPLKKIKFENKEYNAPNDIDYVLTKIYGKNYMELPPKEKRVSHDPIFIKFSDGECVDFTKE